MDENLIWVHEKGLNQWLIQSRQDTTMAVFIWDNNYFQKRAYSLKRLVFIYESLCQLPVEIIQGDTFEVIKELAPKTIITQATTDTEISTIISSLSKTYNLEVVLPQPFVTISSTLKFTRFFPYWRKAKKSGFLKNGGLSWQKE